MTVDACKSLNIYTTYLSKCLPTASETQIRTESSAWIIDGLALPNQSNDMCHRLQDLCLSADVMQQVQARIDSATTQVSHAARLSFDRVMEFQRDYSESEEVFRKYEDALTIFYRRQYQDRASQCVNKILDEVKGSGSCYEYSDGVEHKPGHFTDSGLALLEAAFQQKKKLSMAEKRGLAKASKLSEKQVATWFANQRQRRGRLEQSPHASRLKSRRRTAVRNVSGQSVSSEDTAPSTSSDEIIAADQWSSTEAKISKLDSKFRKRSLSIPQSRQEGEKFSSPRLADRSIQEFGLGQSQKNKALWSERRVLNHTAQTKSDLSSDLIDFDDIVPSFFDASCFDMPNTSIISSVLLFQNQALPYYADRSNEQLYFQNHTGAENTFRNDMCSIAEGLDSTLDFDGDFWCN